MIYGIGVDIVNIGRFKRAVERWGERLQRRLFTDGELSYCLAKSHPERHLAVRFAAKEALFKALGGSLPFKNVEVTREASGRPTLNVAGLQDEYRINVSMSHEREFCVAHVVVEKF
jgi:holo-[acyl-carrier protein] synthase